MICECNVLLLESSALPLNGHGTGKPSLSCSSFCLNNKDEGSSWGIVCSSWRYDWEVHRLTNKMNLEGESGRAVLSNCTQILWLFQAKDRAWDMFVCVCIFVHVLLLQEWMNSKGIYGVYYLMQSPCQMCIQPRFMVWALSEWSRLEGERPHHCRFSLAYFLTVGGSRCSYNHWLASGFEASPAFSLNGAKKKCPKLDKSHWWGLCWASEEGKFNYMGLNWVFLSILYWIIAVYFEIWYFGSYY